MSMSMFDAAKFTVASAKSLPVILLLDTSGSMAGEKIESLNRAVTKMLVTFAKEPIPVSDVLVSIVTFGGQATIVQLPRRASEVCFVGMDAGGGTPLGAALDLTRVLIEDRVQIPSRSYRPLVVLVSDGVPTDEWASRLSEFVQTGRSSKCDRMAMGIGPEAKSGEGRRVLESFVAGTGHAVFGADDAGEIHKFFKLVTMSVVSRGLSATPNAIPNDDSLTPPERNIAADGVEAQGPADDDDADGDDEDGYW